MIMINSIVKMGLLAFLVADVVFDFMGAGWGQGPCLTRSTTPPQQRRAALTLC